MHVGSLYSQSALCVHTKRTEGQIERDAYCCFLMTSCPLRSPCGHIFCRPCAERRFSSTNTCSLCDAAFDLETELIELSHERSQEAAVAAFSLAVTYPEEAWRILVEASLFCRTQTALYGT